MNIGSYQQLVDSKGRIILPGAFRQSLGTSFIISAGFDRCLTLWRTEDWPGFVDRELRRVELAKDVRRMSRWFHSGAHPVDLDSQYRFLIPPPLRDYARLIREIILVGAGDHIEIWNRDEWSTYMDAASSSIEELAQTLPSSH